LAAVGVRVAWARGWNGPDAPASLVWDGNKFSAIRLTVDHHMQGAMGKQNPGAAFWVRIGSNLDEAGFDAWRKAFASASSEAQADAQHVLVRAKGAEGGLAVAADAPYAESALIEPPVEKVVLEVDGQDLGRAILRQAEPMKSMRSPQPLKPIDVPQRGGVYFEAESGQVLPSMTIDKDPSASAGAYVWMPGQPGGKGNGFGNVTFKLNIPRSADYYLWGRVLSPTPDDDSFNVKILQGLKPLVRTAAWALGTHKQWTWVRMTLGDNRQTAFALHPGEVTLQISVREDGTRIDRLFITSIPDELPTQPR
jgi:hypothetical protein